MNHPHEDLVRSRLEDRRREAARLALLAEVSRVEAVERQAALAGTQRPAPPQGWVRVAAR